MNKLFTIGAAAIAIAASSAPAHAVTYVDLGSTAVTDLDPSVDFYGQFTFFQKPLAAGDYLKTYTFTLPETGEAAASLSTSLQGGGGITFTKALLNGVAMLLDPDFKGGAVYNVAANNGSNKLEIFFNNAATGTAAFTGEVSAVVPEPSTWAMMVLGVGLVGAGLRRRQNVTVRYA